MGSSAAKCFFFYTLEYPVLPQDMMGLYPTQYFILVRSHHTFILLSARLQHVLSALPSPRYWYPSHYNLTVVKYVLPELV